MLHVTLNSDMELNSGVIFGVNQTNYIDVASKYLIVNSKGKFKWNGSFEELKSLMNVLMKQETKWTAPGGNCKLFETNDLTVRWYYNNNSLTINGNASKDIKFKLNKMANLYHSEACVKDSDCKQIEENVVDTVQVDLSEACRCTCTNRVINADLEGLKLDMTILESRLLAALSENEDRCESVIGSLRLKIMQIEGIMKDQDEVIARLSEENELFKSKLV